MPGIPVINSFTANAYTIDKGSSVTLSWNTSFCTWVKLNGSSVGLSGSKSFTPLTTTTYTLTTMGDRGAPSKSLTVNVAGGGGGGGGDGNGGGGGGDIVICTPGALKCQGADLYVCNPTGTAWTLKQANAPSCKGGGQIPDFWTDPVGWVIGTITAAWESMLGFVSGQFNIFLANVKNFNENFSTQLADFMLDPAEHVKKWVEGLIPSLEDWIGDITIGIQDWWSSMSSTVQTWISNAVAAANDFIKDFPGIIGDWWATVADDVGDWIDDAVSGINQWIKDFPGVIEKWWDETSSGIWDAINNAWADFSGWIGETWDNIGAWWDDQVEIIQRSWDNVVDGLGTWWDDQIEILQRGWDNTFAEIPGLIDGAVSGIKDYIADFVPELVSGMFEWAKPIIKPIQDAVAFLGNISNLVMGTYPKDETITEIQKKQKDAKQRLQELMARK
jgi:hypothetical protein